MHEHASWVFMVAFFNDGSSGLIHLPSDDRSIASGGTDKTGII
jgi:hypothetical protein